MNFINTGLDDEILKSLDAEHPSEDLIKAMNKQGLVQKEVQVRGKNGKMFTRKQWVKASDVKAGGDSQGSSTKVDKDSDKKKVTLKGAKLQMYNDRRTPYSLSNAAFGFTEKMRQSKFPHIKNTGYQDSAQAFREIVEGAKPTGKGICDALNTSGIGYRNWKVTSESDDKIVIQASDTLGNKTNLAIYPVSTKEKSNESAKETVRFDKTRTGRVGGIQIGKELATVIKNVPSGAKKLREVTDKDTGKTYSIYSIHSSNHPDDIVAVENQSQPKTQSSQKDLSKMSESELKDRMKQVTTRMSELSKEMNNNAKAKGQLNSVATDAQKKEYDDLVEENGKILVELGKRQKDNKGNSARTFKDGVEAITAGEKDAGKKSINSQKVVDYVKENYINAVYRKGKGMSDSQSEKFCKKAAKQLGVPENNIWYETSKQFEEWDNETNKKTSAATSQQPAGQKLSKEDAKKKTQSYTNKVGKTDSERNAFMDKVRAQGITWKEKNDNGTEVSVGINWMRCLMSLNKHFANGGSFDEK